jgi:hypothetical protein
MLFLLLAQAAMPMAAATPCAAPIPLPAAWASFADGTPVTAAASAAAADAATLPLGRGAKATLLPAAALTLAAPLTKAMAANAHGGLFAFTVPVAGRYRVGLSRGVWIDVVANGATLPSAAHAHGPDCTMLRKIVEWDLKPGRYLLQVAGDADPTLSLGVFKAG